MISIDRLPPLPQINPGAREAQPQKLVPGQEGSFGETLKQFIGDVNEMATNAADKEMKFATGQIKDIHEVMAASEEASISIQLLMEIRNKALDAYRELMRTPV